MYRRLKNIGYSLLYIILFISIIINVYSNLYIKNLSNIRKEENESYERILCKLVDSACNLGDSLEDQTIKNHTQQNTIYELEMQISNLLEVNSQYLDTSSLYEYIGDFYVTSYCSCRSCCGKYAENRPVYNGQELVFTANGSLAEEGITVAVDPSVIPHGTKIYIEGVGVRIAQDTGGVIKGNRLDVYYDSHKEALGANLNDQDRKVWILNENF